MTGSVLKQISYFTEAHVCFIPKFLSGNSLNAIHTHTHSEAHMRKCMKSFIKAHKYIYGELELE